MSQAPPTYDLVLLLDPLAEEPARQRVLSEAKARIEAHGELTRADEWGLRGLTYPIRHKTEAEYHLLQFHVRERDMLNELDRSLRLSDEVLRFMITKLAPGTPEAPSNPDTRAPRHAPVAEPEPAAAA